MLGQQCDTMVGLFKRLSGAGGEGPSAQFLWHALLKNKVLNNCWAHICHHWNSHSRVCLTENSKIATWYKNKRKNVGSESLSPTVDLPHKNIPSSLASVQAFPGHGLQLQWQWGQPHSQDNKESSSTGGFLGGMDLAQHLYRHSSPKADSAC